MHRNLYLPPLRGSSPGTFASFRFSTGPKQSYCTACTLIVSRSFLPDSGLQNSQAQETRNKQICTDLSKYRDYYVPQNTALHVVPTVLNTQKRPRGLQEYFNPKETTRAFHKTLCERINLRGCGGAGASVQHQQSELRHQRQRYLQHPQHQCEPAAASKRKKRSKTNPGNRRCSGRDPSTR